MATPCTSGVLDLLRRRRREAVPQHLHLDETALALSFVARLLGEHEHDRGHALEVDDVERHRQIAGAAAGDGEPLGFRAPVEAVAEQVAEGLAQEIERHLEAAVALHRRLRERDDGVAHGDDGVCPARSPPPCRRS